MAKKKRKLTPKDDLIDSLMNDVQEISDQETKHGDAPEDLFLHRYEAEDDGDEIVGLGVKDNHAGDVNGAAEDLWQAVKGPGPKVKESSHQDDKTININEMSQKYDSPSELDSAISDENLDSARTIAVEGFANRQPRNEEDVSPKISFGVLRGSRSGSSGSVYASADATLAQAESLKVAQQRILELEKEVEKYRQENEELASAGEIIRNRSEELTSRIFALENEKQEIYDSSQNELLFLKGSLQFKETELNKARLKIDELETRLKSDFKKIRVRERELENRLELVKAEKTALLRAKDENILELKRKIDHLESEMDNYRRKVLELNKTIDANQEQFKRTVRALRLALGNLEVKEENAVPLKKAE